MIDKYEIGSPISRGHGQNLNIEIDKDSSVGGFRLFIVGKFCNDVIAANEISFQKIDMYGITPTALTINETEAQILMESLWKAGVRPKSGEGSVGQLAATENHLKDMRNLVSHFTKTDFAP